MDERCSDNFRVTRLNIKEVMKKSINIYKTGIRPFITLSALIFVLSFINNIINFSVNVQKSNQSFYFLLSLLSLVFIVIYFCLSVRAGIAIYFIAHQLYINKDICAKEAFKKSKEVFWRYIGVYVLYGIKLTIPVISMILAYRFIENLAIKIFVILIFFIPTGYLMTIYGFAPIFAILKKENGRYFLNSKRLVTGDFWGTFILLFISSLVLIIPYQIYIRILFDYSQMAHIHRLVASSVNQLFYMFTTPFTYTITVVIYQTLKVNKRIG